MFGLGRNTPRYSRGATGNSSKLRGALLAGAGLLAYRWWQNRKHSETGGNRAGNGSTGWSERAGSWSERADTSRAQQSGFAAGGTTPGGSAF